MTNMQYSYVGTVAGFRSWAAGLAYGEVWDDMTPWPCVDCGDLLPQCGTGNLCLNCKEEASEVTREDKAKAWHAKNAEVWAERDREFDEILKENI